MDNVKIHSGTVIGADGFGFVNEKQSFPMEILVFVFSKNRKTHFPNEIWVFLFF